jgi:tetratricopeptide (TPR) repeat protein
LLTGGGRTVVARQQTLRALIDWSYDLLSDPERLLLRRLSVFVRGWTLEAAEAVCSGDGIGRDAILDLLAHLVDKSLVSMQERGGAARYSMLETVREYAREKLVDSGDAPTLRQRHVDYFLGFASDGSLAARQPGGSPEWVRMAIEYENLIAALEWIKAEPNGSERELLLVGSMGGIALALGRLAEFRQIVAAALQRSDPTARTLGRARVLWATVALAWIQDDRMTARAVAAEAVELFRTLGQKKDLAWALTAVALTEGVAASASVLSDARAIFEESGDTRSLGVWTFVVADVALQRGDYAAARSGHTESLALFRGIGDLQQTTRPLIRLGRIACVDGDYTRARALVEEAVAICRQNEVDNHWSLAIALNSLGEIDRCEGNSSHAAPLFDEALRYGRVLGDESIIGSSIHNLGHVALQADEPRTAAARFRESLVLRRRGGPGVNVAAGLAGLAGVAARDGSLTESAWLFGAVDAMLETAHGVLLPADELVRQADLGTIRAGLDPDAFAAALSKGRAAAPEEVEGMARRTSSAIRKPRDQALT